MYQTLGTPGHMLLTRFQREVKRHIVFFIKMNLGQGMCSGSKQWRKKEPAEQTEEDELRYGSVFEQHCPKAHTPKITQRNRETFAIGSVFSVVFFAPAEPEEELLSTSL